MAVVTRFPASFYSFLVDVEVYLWFLFCCVGENVFVSTYCWTMGCCVKYILPSSSKNLNNSLLPSFCQKHSPSALTKIGRGEYKQCRYKTTHSFKPGTTYQKRRSKNHRFLLEFTPCYYCFGLRCRKNIFVIFQHFLFLNVAQQLLLASFVQVNGGE